MLAKPEEVGLSGARLGRINDHLRRYVDTGKLAGDVDFDSVVTRAGAITPVPGGVGLMTIAMLLKNTLAAAEGRIGK